MYISRTQFCLVVQATCYIVQSSADPACPIPRGGYVCKDYHEQHEHFNSKIRIGVTEREVLCSTLNVAGTEMIGVAIDFNLDVNGEGMHCDTFSYLFNMNTIYITGRSREPEEHPLQQLSEEELHTLGRQLNKDDKKWALEILNIRQANELSHNSEMKVTFTVNDVVLAPRVYMSGTSQHPFEITLNREVTIQIKPDEIHQSNNDHEWAIGYSQLAGHQAEFIKREEYFYISLAREASAVDITTHTQ